MTCAHPMARALSPGGCPLCPQANLPIALARNDGWINGLTGHGDVNFDKTRSTTFYTDLVTDYQAEQLWRGNDLAARVIELWPNEMLRQGFELCVDADADTEDPQIETLDDLRRSLRRDAAENYAKDAANKVMTRWEELGLQSALWKGLAYRRCYGGGGILLGVNDGSSDLTQPLNTESVISFDWLTVLEARELQPYYYYNDPTAPKYGEVEIYLLSPQMVGASRPGTPTKTQSVIVHESRVVAFDGIRVSRTQSTFNGWGDSVLTRFLPVLSQFGIGWNSAAILLADFAQAVFKIKGLASAMAQDKDDIIKIRSRAVQLSMSTARAVLIDAEEEFERKQTPVSGLPELLDRFASRLAAAADIPVELLMGESPAGLNATGDSAIRFFYDKIKAAQEQVLRPAIDKITSLIWRTMGGEPASWYVEFAPLWQPTEKEIAETRKLVADTDKVYIESGVYSPEEAAMSRFGGDTYSMETQIDFKRRELGEPAADPPAKTAQQVAEEEKAAADKAEQLRASLERQPTQQQPTAPEQE